MTVLEQVSPSVRRLEVAGKFAGGMHLSAEGCRSLALGLREMARQLDEYHEQELRRWFLRWVVVEALKCVLFVGALALITVLTHG